MEVIEGRISDMGPVMGGVVAGDDLIALDVLVVAGGRQSGAVHALPLAHALAVCGVQSPPHGQSVWTCCVAFLTQRRKISPLTQTFNETFFASQAVLI